MLQFSQLTHQHYHFYPMKTLSHVNTTSFDQLLLKFGIKVCHLDLSDDIPGSYWGAPEAGIIKNQLFVRPDTPVHSALHESCHYICMDHERREKLHTDTGGDYDEENAVCYLQILLADLIPNIGQNIMCENMDEWGYTFRLGSAKRWLKEDADDALQWLLNNNIIDQQKYPTWKIRH